MSRVRSRRVAIGALVGTAVALATSASAASAADRIYWANFVNDTISYANLDGSGGDVLNTAGVTITDPTGVSLDPAAGRIYWSNLPTNKIPPTRTSMTVAAPPTSPQPRRRSTAQEGLRSTPPRGASIRQIPGARTRCHSPPSAGAAPAAT